MPFGLTNAPAIFQWIINKQLYKYLNIFLIAYLDNILIFSKIEAEHIKHIKKVLRKIKEANLLLKLEKCEFYKDRVSFLRFIIRRDRIKIDPSKVEAVLSWPMPNTVKEVQAFLGFANFYRRFIEGYSRVAKPLTELTKKDQGFN